MPHCYTVGCRNSTRTTGAVSYHSFPKDNRLRAEWLTLIGRNPNSTIIYEKVCSDHFNENDIILVGNRKYLIPCAVPVQNLPSRWVDPRKDPILNLPKSLADLDLSLPLEPVKKKNRFLADVVTEQTSPGTSSLSLKSDEPSCEPSCSGIQRNTTEKKQFHSDTSSSGSPLSASSSVKRRIIKTIHNYSRSPEHYKKEISQHARKVTLLKHKFKMVQKTVRRQKKKISSLKQVVGEVKKKIKMSTDAIQVLEDTFSGVPLELMRRILQTNRTSSQRKSFNKGYPVELKRFAMTLQFYSSKAYNYVRKAFDLALPAPSTIRAWMAKIDCSPGFTKPAIEVLNIRSTQYREKNGGKQLLGCLLLDEMAVKMEIVCEKHSGALWGYVDVGANAHSGNEQEVANHAFVFMVVGVNDCFKIPIGYFFIKSLTGEERANLVREALNQLSTVDMKILAITCDGPHVHFKMMKELGCKINDVENLEPFFLHPTNNDIIHIIFDVCHMLKLVRNNWASAQVIIDPNGNEIKWKFIEDLYKIQEQEGFYFGNKLREKHTKWKKYIMKVNVAAQTLSNSVADTLEFLCKDCKLEEFKNVMPTVHFIRTFNNLFDLLNSRNPFAKGMKTPLRKENEFYWRPFLHTAAEYIKNLKLVNGTYLYASTRKVPFIGFLVAIKSFLDMYEDEVKTKNSIKYLLTYKFSQDHLELFFCSVRSRNGPNNNPNCLQFFHTYRRLLSHIDIKNNTGNCLIQDNTEMLGVTEIQNKQITDIFWERKREEEIKKIEENVQRFLPNSLTFLQENTVSYIAGFIIRSLIKQLTCTSCAEALTQQYDECDSSLVLIQRKTRGGLIYPARSVRLICNKIEGLIKLINNLLGYLPRKDILIEFLIRQNQPFLENGNIFPTLHSHMFDQTPYEINHRQTLIINIIKKYTLIRLNSLAHKINETISGEKVRKTLNKLVLFRHQ